MIPHQELIIFDLDGTLSESKQPLDSEMAGLFMDLLKIKKVAVISGGAWRQFETQFLHGLPSMSEYFGNLLLLPTSGTRLRVWKGAWIEQYAELISAKDKDRILHALAAALRLSGFEQPTKIYGTQIEDRDSQITFSALGQDAPFPLKDIWDPNQAKRKKIVDVLATKLPGFDVRIGGTTSIDITMRGVNKAYGIRKLELYLNLRPEQILFVGDALYHGGNDYPAKATGVDCIQVKDPDETKKLISGWLAVL